MNFNNNFVDKENKNLNKNYETEINNEKLAENIVKNIEKKLNDDKPKGVGYLYSRGE